MVNERSFRICNARELEMRMQKHWYLGFFGLVGFYKLPTLIAFFSATGTWWDAANVLWFLWLLYFVPEQEADTEAATDAGKSTGRKVLP